MYDGICCESIERGEKEEVPSSVLDLAECLQELGSSSSVCRFEKQFAALCRERSNPRTFRNHMSSVANIHETKHSAWTRGLVKTEFEGI